MSNIKKTLIAGLIGLVGAMTCGCGMAEDMNWVEAEMGATIVENVEHQMIDGYGENIDVYAFTDIETGTEYLLFSNMDGIQLVERGTNSESDFDFEEE